MVVVPIRNPEMKKAKVVEATQKAIDELPFDSGDWSVKGESGLYVRCRVGTKTFRLQRRVGGVLVKKTLVAQTVRDAKEAARAEWARIKPVPAGAGVRLGAAIEEYLDSHDLAERTKVLARYNAKRHLSEWESYTLESIGNDRAGVRALQGRITRKYGRATSNQVVRLLSAVYNWYRKVNTELPESPMVAAQIHRIKPRDWAYSADELRAWWSATRKEKDGAITKAGVSTLGTLKRMFWITLLLTGARRGSVEALKWSDVDLDRKVIYFRIAKGDRAYSVPAADVLVRLLKAYRKSPDIVPGEWVFPSPSRDGAHIINSKNAKQGVGGAHHLRHTFRTVLALPEIGAGPDGSLLLMGHSMSGNVSTSYITSSVVLEGLRPIVNAVAAHYCKIVPGIVE